MFINATIREAYKRHCVRGGLADMVRKLTMIKRGMAKRQVKEVLGSPTKVRYDGERLTWQYTVGDELRSVEFYKGRVCGVDAPAATEELYRAAG